MIEPLIIADSSPLIALARIQQLPLLRNLAGRILIPPAVLAEVTVDRPDAPGAVAVRNVDWLEVATPAPEQVKTLTTLLGRGEAEAIALAQGKPGALLLLDDARARRVAEQMGLRRIGTVGLLRRAKKAGLIDEVKSILEALQTYGIFIHQKLVIAVLRDLGEEP